ncbi:hypothetical protein, partial [Bradyrhizobium sp. NBAIM08]|uniref:hypothetical protein n=1 Tax=Bradyrhizobium sp. NBAIM08 TaxID=2793815 RepID=UPI001CD2A2F8
FFYTNVAGRIDVCVDVDCPGIEWANCVTNRIEQWVYTSESVIFEVNVYRGIEPAWSGIGANVWEEHPDYVGSGWWRLTNTPVSIRVIQ